jgi:hypothetical protein
MRTRGQHYESDLRLWHQDICSKLPDHKIRAVHATPWYNSGLVLPTAAIILGTRTVALHLNRFFCTLGAGLSCA